MLRNALELTDLILACGRDGEDLRKMFACWQQASRAMVALGSMTNRRAATRPTTMACSGQPESVRRLPYRAEREARPLPLCPVTFFSGLMTGSLE